MDVRVTVIAGGLRAPLVGDDEQHVRPLFAACAEHCGRERAGRFQEITTMKIHAGSITRTRNPRLRRSEADTSSRDRSSSFEIRWYHAAVRPMYADAAPILRD